MCLMRVMPSDMMKANVHDGCKAHGDRGDWATVSTYAGKQQSWRSNRGISNTSPSSVMENDVSQKFGLCGIEEADRPVALWDWHELRGAFYEAGTTTRWS